jgi:hypothetical protein
MDTPKQMTINASLLQAISELPDLPDELAKQVRFELDQQENVDREIRRLSMRLDTLMPAPSKWPETIEQVSASFHNKSGPELMREISTALEWISSPTWVTRSARLVLTKTADATVA